jgi:cysteinyl-tRNA synthetase
MSTPALKIYNTLTRKKEEFRPLDPANVRMYVCGPTVYDYAHIGNARPLIVFDVLFRLLRHLAKQGMWDGGRGETKVTYVRNITDVDDKINARATERGISIRELTEETNRVFQEDVKALGCLEPTIQPRATEHIAQMIAIIERLIASGHAYAADGHVLFDVPSMPNYGRLSRRSLDEMIAGARVDVAPYKRGDMDFVLWKPSKENEPGWDSPWGRGRPGWHIECSAMSWAHLGETFDIHGGGIDLVFPHHENEIAQSCCAFDREVMANYWMHNGFLQVEGEKMSKSLGNFVTIHELLSDWAGETIRLAMLMTHYRQPINWTITRLREADNKLDNWYRSMADDIMPSKPDGRVVAALCDDLNVWEALQRLDEMYAERKKLPMHTPPHVGRELQATFKASANLIGVLTGSWDNWQQERISRQTSYDLTWDESLKPFIDARIAERLAARAAKNWAESDRIRDELAAMGIALKDNKDGTTSWEVKR